MVRPFSATHYNPCWFDREDAICVAFGISTKKLAETLETAGIMHLKHKLGVGVNHCETSNIPHDNSVSRKAALYIVPVVDTISTQAQFESKHLSNYMMVKGLEVTTIADRRSSRQEARHDLMDGRAKKLDDLMDAFTSSSSAPSRARSASTP